MARTTEQKFEARLAVMTAACELFKTRRSEVTLYNSNLAKALRFDDVWKAYALARPCLWALGDDSGVRGFLPHLFTRMLNRVEAETGARLRHDNDRAIQAAAARLESSIDQSMRDLAARMTQDERDTRIRAILSEIELLPYRAFSVNIRKRGSDLRAELQVLLDASQPEAVEPIAKAVLRREMLETLEGRKSPSRELTELRERARLGLSNVTHPIVGLAAVLSAGAQ